MVRKKMQENNRKSVKNINIRAHASVFGLYARSSIGKVLGILLLMSGVQMALFAKFYFLDHADGKQIYSFLDYIEMSKVFWICIVGFLLITVTLCVTGTEYGSKTSYTLKRLSVSEKSTFFYQAMYNMFVYILFGAVQLVVVFVMGRIYVETVVTDIPQTQTLFLAFYQNHFLHALLPLEDVLLWWRNFSWLIALGIVTAEFPYVQRRGSKINIALIVMIAMVILFGGTSWGIGDDPINPGANCIVTSFVAYMIIILKVLAFSVFGKERSYEE